MTLTSVDKDPETRTMTYTTQFDAPVARVWQVWSDPRQLDGGGAADLPGDGPNADLPTTMVRVTLQEQAGGGTRMEIASTFPSLEAMEQLIAMGMEEGMAAAIGQIDQLLAPQGR